MKNILGVLCVSLFLATSCRAETPSGSQPEHPVPTIEIDVEAVGFSDLVQIRDIEEYCVPINRAGGVLLALSERARYLAFQENMFDDHEVSIAHFEAGKRYCFTNPNGSASIKRVEFYEPGSLVLLLFHMSGAEHESELVLLDLSNKSIEFFRLPGDHVSDARFSPSGGLYLLRSARNQSQLESSPGPFLSTRLRVDGGGLSVNLYYVSERALGLGSQQASKLKDPEQQRYIPCEVDFLFFGGSPKISAVTSDQIVVKFQALIRKQGGRWIAAESERNWTGRYAYLPVQDDCLSASFPVEDVAGREIKAFTDAGPILRKAGTVWMAGEPSSGHNAVLDRFATGGSVGWHQLAFSSDFFAVLHRNDEGLSSATICRNDDTDHCPNRLAVTKVIN